MPNTQTPPRTDVLDDLLTRIRQARQRPTWLKRVLPDSHDATSLNAVRVLRAVEIREAEDVGASVRDVAEYLGVEHSTASRSVTNLVAGGLLDKSSSPQDQRRCVLTLTDSGRGELAAITARRHEVMAQTMRRWADDDVDTLIGLLARLADDLEADPAR